MTYSRKLGASALILLWVSTLTQNGHSADVGIGTQTPFAVPSAFNNNTGAGLSSLYTSCFNLNPALSQMGRATESMIKKRSGGTASAGAVGMLGFQIPCVGSENGPSASSLTCDAFTVGGSFSKASLDAQKRLIDTALSTLQCKKTKLEYVSAEMSCLTDKANQLAQQMASLKSEYDRNINAFKEQYQKYQNDETDRQAQVKFLTDRLDGSKDTGALGLLKLKDAAAKWVNQDIRVAINKASATVKGIKQRRAMLDRTIKNRKMGLTTRCFTEDNSGKRCEITDAEYAASIRPKSSTCKYGSICDYMLCRYWQNSNFRKDKNNYVSQIDKRNNVRKMQDLESLLTRIFDRAPKDSKVPTKPEEYAAANDRAVNFFNPSQIDSVYGAKLSQFNDAGLDIRNLVKTELGRCYKTADVAVENERSDLGSPVGAEVQNITVMEEANNSEMKNALDQYTHFVSDIYAGLTGKAQAISPKGCQNSTPDTMVSCLENMRDYMRGLLTGDGLQGQFQIMIPSNDAKKSFIIRCNGLNGCVSDMQLKMESVKQEVQAIGNAKKAFIMQAKQATENFTNVIKDRFQAQNKMLHDHIRDLNEALRSLGAGQIKVRSKGDPESARLVEGQPDGMVQSPDDVALLIGSRMNPPLVDANASSFSEALADIGRQTTRYDEKLAALMDAENVIKVRESECPLQTLRSKVERAGAAARTLVESKCTSSYQWCARESRNTLEDLVSTWNSVSGGVSVEGASGVSSALSGGQANCLATITNKERADEARKRCEQQVIGSKGGDDLDRERIRRATCGDEFDRNIKGVELADLSGQCGSLVSNIRKEIDGVQRVVNEGNSALIKR